MNIEEYFDYLASDDIRIKGTRIGIESVLYEYIHREQSPESIQKRFPSLSLEQIYATILYYLHNRDIINHYMTDWLEFGYQMRAEQKKNPPPVIVRLRSIKEQHKEVYKAK